MNAKDVLKLRKPGHGVDPIFPSRWSPRAMSGEAISEGELMKLFEAARWAPSAYNAQPWRFIYARRDTKHWDGLFNLMGDFNKSWTRDAAALVVMISRKTFEYNGRPSVTHSFDAGSAWMSLALQGSIMGLVVHGMEGFDYDRARKDLGVPDDFQVEAMAAIGKPGDPKNLPHEIRERESPSGRKTISEVAFEGTFRK
jgi:nitroreductase